MIYLYVKTHSITGLRYLGQTKQKDPYSYKGSGMRWLNHLKVHGPHYTTEIIFQSEDLQEIKKVGLYYSSLWNITKDSQWANLMEESGTGGALTSDSLNKMRETCIERFGVENISQTAERRKERSILNKEMHASGKLTHSYFKPNDPRGAKSNLPQAVSKRKKTYELINHQRGCKNSQFGTLWITNGSINKKIKSDLPIPCGWYKGRSITVAE
jgi:hypothetical protein